MNCEIHSLWSDDPWNVWPLDRGLQWFAGLLDFGGSCLGVRPTGSASTEELFVAIYQVSNNLKKSKMSTSVVFVWGGLRGVVL